MHQRRALTLAATTHAHSTRKTQRSYLVYGALARVLAVAARLRAPVFISARKYFHFLSSQRKSLRRSQRGAAGMPSQGSCC